MPGSHILLHFSRIFSVVCLLLAAFFALKSFRRQVRPGAFLILSVRFAILLFVAVLLFYPTLVTENEIREKPRLLVYLDTSSSMGLPATGTSNSPKPASRLDKGLQDVKELVARYEKYFTVQVMHFSSSVSELADYFEGFGTDLSAPIKDGFLKVQQREGVKALFIVSDGQDTTAANPVDWARQLPVPLYSIQSGDSTLSTTDSSVSFTGTPQTAFLTSILELNVSYSFSEKGNPYSLVLYENGIEKARKSVSSSDGSGRSVFEIRPGTQGLVKYLVKLQGDGKELTLQNNEASTMIMVRDRPEKVIFMSFAPGADGGYFLSALKSDSRFLVESHKRIFREKVLTLSTVQFEKVPLVVIHKFDRAGTDLSTMEALVTYVENGGTILFIGNGFGEAEELLASPLANLLPFGKSPKDKAATIGATVALEKLYWEHPILTVLSHEQANLFSWRNLPPVVPGLVINHSAISGMVLAGFRSSEGLIPAILLKRVSKGACLYLNSKELWKWRLSPALSGRKDDMLGGAFRNLTSWAGARNRASLLLYTSRFSYVAGDNARIYLHDYRTESPADRKSVECNIQYEGHVQSERIELLPSGKKEWTGSYRVRQKGQANLKVKMIDGAAVDTSFVVDSNPVEYINPQVDKTMLRDIAKASGGSFLISLSDLDSVDFDISPKVSILRTTLYWLDEYLVLLSLLLFLCFEWGLRRSYTGV
jgi:hypothetical protein